MKIVETRTKLKMTSKQSKRIAALEKELAAEKKKKKGAQQSRAQGPRRSGPSAAQKAAVLLNPFSRRIGAKWPDSNAARSVTLRSRTLMSIDSTGTVSANASNDIVFAIVADPSGVLKANPDLNGSGDVITTWANADVEPVQNYANLLADSTGVRIVALGAKVRVTQNVLDAQGTIVAMISNGTTDALANANSLPGKSSDQTISKQVYTFSNGKEFSWHSNMLDNGAMEYQPANALAASNWTSLAVFCKGLKTGATVHVEIHMDLEIMPAVGKILASTATSAAKYDPAVLAAAANMAATAPGTWETAMNVAGVGAGIVAGAAPQVMQYAARQMDNHFGGY